MDAILLQENQMSAFPDLNKTFMVGVGEFAKDRLRSCDRTNAVPLCEDN